MRGVAMRTNNGYELSDFSVDIFESGGSIHIKMGCFADNNKDAPFHVYNRQIIDAGYYSSRELFYAVLSASLGRMINDLLNTEIRPPVKCECQSREWFQEHPDDHQEYWRTKNGRVYPKDHTNNCPKNPINLRRN
jgi:hypothetical protein